MPSVALVTCRELPAGDEDADLLLSALTAAGVDASWQVWDDRSVDWSFDLTVIRSTWDYTPRRAEFLTWTRSVTRLANEADVIAWNSDKRYLRDLAEHGVPIVETVWIESGDAVQLPGDGEYVIKPSVGAGSMGAGRFSVDDPGADAAARAHIAHLHGADRTVLVQPYVAAVDTVGETSLIYFDGAFSHSITKGAMLPHGAVYELNAGYSHSLFVEERISPHEASAGELAVGDTVMAELGRRAIKPLYARVDLLPTAAGPALVELELAEPSVFLSHSDGAADRFAAAIVARA